MSSSIRCRRTGSRSNTLTETPDTGRHALKTRITQSSTVARCGELPQGNWQARRIGLKNNVSVAGMPMTCGTLLLRDYIADTDATIVTRMLDEGAEITALLNLENFCFSGAGDTSTFGAVLNPYDTNHLAGGSSGGSGAALFYDDIDITIGGDQGGSIRIPASWCGVVGLKPTHGLVPYTGIVGIDNTCDHTGPMARTVADVALAMEAIAGKDTMDPRQAGEVPVEPYTELLGRGIAGLRIGVLTEGFGTPRSEPDVDESVRKAVGILSELGANVGEVSRASPSGSARDRSEPDSGGRNGVNPKQRHGPPLGRPIHA